MALRHDRLRITYLLEGVIEGVPAMDAPHHPTHWATRRPTTRPLLTRTKGGNARKDNPTTDRPRRTDSPAGWKRCVNEVQTSKQQIGSSLRTFGRSSSRAPIQGHHSDDEGEEILATLPLRPTWASIGTTIGAILLSILVVLLE